MRFRSALFALLVILFAAAAFARDVWIPIAGTVSQFRTDLRIINPSTTADLTLTAKFVPVCTLTSNQLSCTGTPLTTTISVPKRQMKVIDDAVSFLFNTNVLGAIEFSSPLDFVVTARIYAQTSVGTLGQFEVGVETPSQQAMLPQLKISSAFRTNIGLVNPGSASSDVTLTLHDRSSALLSLVVRMPGGSVLGPTNLVALFNPTADVSDAWLAYSSTQPVFAYASVIDNATTDPTFIAALADSGSDPTTPQTRNVLVDVGPGLIFIPSGVSIRPGDTVTWVFHGAHNTKSDSQSGAETWSSPTMGSGQFAHTFHTPGEYPYFCSLHSVPGGSAMNGVVTVTP